MSVPCKCLYIGRVAMGEQAELKQVSGCTSAECTQDISPGLEPSWLIPGVNQALHHM